VRLAAVAGVRLTRPVTLGCAAARALADWTEAVAAPAARARLGAALAAMTPWAGYVCRSVNDRPGAKLSEHALGRAVDLGVFHLEDGRALAVTAWTEGGDAAAFLRALWAGACGRFATVLGPEADVWHADHLHLDLAERRAPYCR
jgi:hypothetical protein